MLILLFIVSIVLLILGVTLVYKANYASGIEYGLGWAFGVIGGILSVASFIALIVCGTILSSYSVVDEKIALYTEENELIYNDVKLTVGEYMEWETDTYEKFAQTDITFVVNMYPELKSNELVMKQIDIYLANKNEIKMLKSQLIDREIFAFWVYFG